MSPASNKQVLDGRPRSYVSWEAHEMAAESEYLDTVTYLMFDEEAWWIIGSRDKTEKVQQKLFVVLSRGEPLAIN